MRQNVSINIHVKHTCIKIVTLWNSTAHTEDRIIGTHSRRQQHHWTCRITKRRTHSLNGWLILFCNIITGYGEYKNNNNEKN